MLGLHFTSTRPVEDALPEHPLAQFSSSAIAQSETLRPSGQGCRRRGACDVLPDRTLRTALDLVRTPQRWRSASGQRPGQRDGDTMNTGIDGYRDIWSDVTGRPTCSTGHWPTENSSSGARNEPCPIGLTPQIVAAFLRNLRRRTPRTRSGQARCCFCSPPQNSTRRSGSVSGSVRPTARNSDENLPPANVYLELEEHYHTRLSPTCSTRSTSLSGGATDLCDDAIRQDRVSYCHDSASFVGAAEMAGSITFDEHAVAGIEVFADEPEAVERIEPAL